MNKQLLETTRQTFSDLYRTLALFSAEQFNRIPFKGSWTPAQVTEHILKAISGVPALCLGNTQEASRPADEKLAGIRKLFLDFSIKMQSPDFILPGNEPHNQEALLTRLKATEEEFTELIQSQDLSLLCAGAELPGSGLLTRQEWIGFALVHTQRHIHQLSAIYERINRHY